MFQAFDILFLYAETSMHAGTGRGMGVVDLPIQRESITHLPMIQANGVRGSLRALATLRNVAQTDVIFGPETSNADSHAGALSVGDARLLFYPVRSLSGVFAWVTRRMLVGRLGGVMALTGEEFPWKLDEVQEPNAGSAWVAKNCSISIPVKNEQQIVLEEFPYKVDESQAEAIQKLGEFVSRRVLPQSPEYAYWRRVFTSRMCVLPNSDLRDFAVYSTEVQTHIKLDLATKTVDGGMLWTQELLPCESILYSPIMATASRKKETRLEGSEVLAAVRNMTDGRIQLGGDETTGQGRTAISFLGGK